MKYATHSGAEQFKTMKNLGGIYPTVRAAVIARYLSLFEKLINIVSI